MSENNGNNTSLRLKTGLAEMLKGDRKSVV